MIGNEAATRAANAPVGMLGLRTVAMAESGEAEAVMGQRGAKRGWGSGVIEDGEEADAPWMDVGVEDAALFVFDSVRSSWRSRMPWVCVWSRLPEKHSCSDREAA